jgi:porphyrinogen peroxidase
MAIKSVNTAYPQSGIAAALPATASYIGLSRHAGKDTREAKDGLRRIAQLVDGDNAVLGISATFAAAIGLEVPNLRAFPTFSGAHVDLPVNQSDIWLWVRGTDPGHVFHTSRMLTNVASATFKVDSNVPAFVHAKGHDLTGFEDGTENPKGKAAARAAFVPEGPWAGSSFVATQLWEHNFVAFDAMPAKARNHTIGRDRASNEELARAPASAHVKRTAQENFVPEAFLLRRSMPWAVGTRGGLVFAAFGRSFDAFEAQLRRMSGAEDGVVDALFSISRPLTGAYYWCPPMRGGRIAL